MIGNPTQRPIPWFVWGGVLLAIIVMGLSLTFLIEKYTREKIEVNRENAQLEILSQVLKKDSFDNNLLKDYFEIQDKELLGHSEPARIHQAKKAGQVTSLVIPAVAPDGYQGQIDILVGVSATGRVLDVRILDHMETPGLGNQVHQDVSDWVRHFSGHSLVSTPTEGWRVKKDGGQFDQFTGATVSPRAVVETVHRTLLYFESNKTRLLQPL